MNITAKTRTTLVLVIGALMIGLFNYNIHAKELVRRDGQAVLLKLAPVDPRSLMQGDYMRLSYQIERDAREMSESLPENIKRGYLVIKPDENNIAQLVRFDDGSELAAGEKRIRFHRPYASRFEIVPHSFFFQEGHGEYYAEAEYGIFKFGDDGNHILTSLADEKRAEIIPPAKAK